MLRCWAKEIGENTRMTKIKITLSTLFGGEGAQRKTVVKFVAGLMTDSTRCRVDETGASPAAHDAE